MTRWSGRKIAFVLASTDHGAMIVNRFDRHTVDGRSFGVCHDILETSSFSPNDVDVLVSLLQLRRRYHGDGVVAIDCGANIGVHTLEWARTMANWGSVIAIEAQERVFYALAGNIALNNGYNARAIFAAVANEDGALKIPELDPTQNASFGSLELKPRSNGEFIGQAIDRTGGLTTEVRSLKLDSLDLIRVDLIKLDIEGMEFEALLGARVLVERCRPILMVEHIKSDKQALRDLMSSIGFRIFERGMEFLAIHENDPVLQHVKE